jgi:hypothetical protein
LISNETKVGAIGAKVLTTWTYFPTHPKVKCWQQQWGPKWEEKDETSKGRALSKQGGIKGK